MLAGQGKPFTGSDDIENHGALSLTRSRFELWVTVLLRMGACVKRRAYGD
jgi:hypothetical protein